jgi:hypothetical protein
VLAAELVLGRVGVIHPIRRISEAHVGQRSAEHALDVGEHGGVAAQQAVLAQEPEIARPRDWVRRRLGHLVLGLGRLRPGAFERQQPLELGGVEAEQIEVEPFVAQPAELLGQQRLVPAGGGGELVVGDDVGPLLGLGEMLQPHDRHFL